MGHLIEVARRPDVWPEAVRAVWAHRRHRWWTSLPFLPVPSSKHLAWRRATAYGSPTHRMEGRDLVAYLEWRRRERKARR